MSCILLLQDLKGRICRSRNLIKQEYIGTRSLPEKLGSNVLLEHFGQQEGGVRPALSSGHVESRQDDPMPAESSKDSCIVQSVSERKTKH
jgi:hypothetical protein